MLKLLLHELGLRRWAIIGWGLGIAIFGAYIIILYPDFAEPMANMNLEEISIYQVFGDFGDFASFTGFVSAELFTFLPVLLGIYAIVNGTGTLAGEEDNGTLEPLMALPIPRWQLLMSKFLALAIAILLILIIVGGGVLIGFNALPSDVNTGGTEAVELVTATLTTWFLVVFFATLSLFLGAAMPSRRIAAMTAGVIFAVSYFGNNLAGLVDFLEDIQFLFVFNYFNGREVIDSGIPWDDVAVLFGASTFFLILALIFFQYRNVTVGAWPWQRARVSS